MSMFRYRCRECGRGATLKYSDEKVTSLGTWHCTCQTAKVKVKRERVKSDDGA